jgi:diamine N-acetyltransferase
MTATASDIQLRPLERGDLHFVHALNNNDAIMRYWFEEPYEAYDELMALYDRHIHDQFERRFISLVVTPGFVGNKMPAAPGHGDGLG